MAELIINAPFPFADNVFPAELGAVVQRSVLDGSEPALFVAHTEDNAWLVGDGVSDPNIEGACVVAPMVDVLAKDEKVTEVADLPVGMAAYRDSADEPWQRESFTWAEEG
ncbi:hypothetical protein D5S17_07975 [Pseudonocardiaceae bacterium YIM PH 21723]|nr:hypothetical protein D5S17_07975 [Pseudonocardiaceae bacterium YIM PH 21723]